MEKWIFFVFLLIVVFLLVAPRSNAGSIIQTLGGAATNQIVALQGRSSGSVLGGLG